MFASSLRSLAERLIVAVKALLAARRGRDRVLIGQVQRTRVGEAARTGRDFPVYGQGIARGQ